MSPPRERNTIECERFAEQTGFTGKVAGHFPDIPMPAAPTFKGPPVYVAPYPRRVTARMRFFSNGVEEAAPTPAVLEHLTIKPPGAQ